MKIFAVITAGGSGLRMNSDRRKQYIDVGNKPILAHTINKFHVTDEIDEIILTAPPEDIEFVKKQIVAKYNFSKVTNIFPGGETRQSSVFEALKQMKGDSDDIILIHDAVRPFISHDIILNCISSCLKYDGSVVGIKPINTIKKLINGVVFQTIDREGLISVQTPQAFRFDLILKCHELAVKENYCGTDDSSLVEKFGKTVLGKDPCISIVEGNSFNIKITSPNDLIITSALLDHLSV